MSSSTASTSYSSSSIYLSSTSSSSSSFILFSNNTDDDSFDLSPHIDKFALTNTIIISCIITLLFGVLALCNVCYLCIVRERLLNRCRCETQKKEEDTTSILQIHHIRSDEDNIEFCDVSVSHPPSPTTSQLTTILEGPIDEQQQERILHEEKY